jgi:stage V sporulation protein B
MKRSNSLLYGTIVLLCSNIFVKGLGFIYRVILVRLLGVEGIGLIEMVSPLFSFLIVIAGWGVPLAASQMIAASGGNRKRADSFFRTSRLLLFFSSTVITVAAYIFTPVLIKNFVPDQRIYLCFRAILPAVFIIGIASAWRSYFQSRRQIAPLGVSQSVEQTIRFILGIFLVTQMASLGIEKAVTATSIATVCGETAGFLYLIFLWRRREHNLPQAGRGRFSLGIAKKLVRFGTPVTFSRLVASIIMMLQALLIPLALQQAGWNVRAATEIYGRFAGVAMTLLHLPGVFTSALAVSILPAVAEDSGKRPLLHKHITTSLQATTVFTLPGMLLLYTFAYELCGWIFHNPLAAPILQILCIGGIFFYLQVTLSSILQGLGAVKILLLNSIISGSVLITGILLLTPRPELGIKGAAIAVVCSWITGFTLNFIYLLRRFRLRLQWQNIFYKPLLGTITSLVVLLICRSQFAETLAKMNKPGVIAQMILMVIVYFVMLAMAGSLSIGVWRRLRRK